MTEGNGDRRIKIGDLKVIANGTAAPLYSPDGNVGGGVPRQVLLEVVSRYSGGDAALYAVGVDEYGVVEIRMDHLLMAAAGIHGWEDGAHCDGYYWKAAGPVFVSPNPDPRAPTKPDAQRSPGGAASPPLSPTGRIYPLECEWVSEVDDLVRRIAKSHRNNFDSLAAFCDEILENEVAVMCDLVNRGWTDPQILTFLGDCKGVVKRAKGGAA